MTKLLTPEELAEILSIRPLVVRRLANNGFIPAIRLTKRTLRFRIDDVLAAMAERQANLVSTR